MEDAWREAVYRESRDENGNLTFLSFSEGKELLRDMTVIDVITGERKKIGDIQI